MNYNLSVDPNFGSISFSFNTKDFKNISNLKEKTLNSRIQKAVDAINGRFFNGEKFLMYSLTDQTLYFDIMNAEFIHTFNKDKYGFHVEFSYNDDIYMLQVSTNMKTLSIQLNISAMMGIL